MSQNIYDTPDFFTNYANLPRSRNGLQDAPEWPRLQIFIPQLKDTNVLDLGCGYGWYSRWLHDHGATTIHAVDISENMLARARTMTDPVTYPGITYRRGDLDEVDLSLLLDLKENSVDLVFSSLALHYLANLKELVGQVQRLLKPGGVFVFSVEHPILTAPSAQGMVEIPVGRKKKAGSGGLEDPGNSGEKLALRRVWPLDNYQAEGVRVTDWLADGVRKQHRTITTYINILLEAGIELTGFNEWYPTKEEVEEHPEWVDKFRNETIKPTFLLMRGTKRCV
ncbi:methyltransferase type 11 [Bombardia bombarda]|uniref:Methyltransferase type 11 n=1 Tax=Bombardia bombarda TaxID=252184 RepID=A0AA39X1A1_9PEZI|nr:methyltransferase type 11 [Bombardia bombarda]